jgi:MFS family permease
VSVDDTGGTDTRTGPREATTGDTGRFPRAHPVSWWMLVITTLAILITSIDRIILPTLLPDISQEFGLSTTAGGLLVSLSFAGTFVGAIVVGVLGDVVGRGYRRSWTWVGTVAVTCVASIATAFTRSVSGLAVWRVIMGVGTGSMEPVNVAMVAEWWPKERRGFATGVHHTGFPIGQFVGPALIGLILVGGTWRDAFLWIPLLAIPIMLLQLVVGSRRNLDRVNHWIDEHRLTPTVRSNEVSTGANPLGSLRTAARERNVWWGSLMAFGLLWAEAGVTAFLTTQLVREAGMDLATAAVVSGASGITGWLGQVVWGTLSDRIGRKPALYIICVGWAATVAAMPLIHGATVAWTVLLAWGLFRNSPFPVVYALVIDSAPEAASSGMGLVIGLAFGLSGVFGPTVSGVLIDQVGFTANYLLMAGICLVMVIPVWLIRETVRAHAPQPAAMGETR